MTCVLEEFGEQYGITLHQHYFLVIVAIAGVILQNDYNT